MKRLYFVRHGETEWNALRRMQGRWNSDLNETGRAQARQHGELLAGLDIEALFVSPLDRTRQTAEIINQKLNLGIAYDDRIVEWDCGDWSGHLRTEIEEKWPDEWAAFRANTFHYRGPNCENFPDMMKRAGPFLEELRLHDASNIAIVSHGLIGRVMVSMLLNYDEEQTLAMTQPNNVVLAVLLDNGGATVAHYVDSRGPFEGIYAR